MPPDGIEPDSCPESTVSHRYRDSKPLGDVIMSNRIQWPDAKDFAFTVFDDTDHASLENVKEVYCFLVDHGFQTTKSVWPVRGSRQPLNGGATCEDREYLEWLYSLQRSGFEIGYHMATFHSSNRKETIHGIEKFAELFGKYPASMANHSGCEENIYWGSSRLTGVHQFVYNLVTQYRYNKKYRGHIEGDCFFWGDICREKVKYVRNFVFPDINTLKACPIMPYHDPHRPYVNYWFASSEGPVLQSFNTCIAEQNQDRLEEEGGACIMYTHLACGFYESDRINARFKSLMKRLSKKNGWFVPVTTLLDYLLQANGHHEIADRERRQLERRWLRFKLARGTS